MRTRVHGGGGSGGSIPGVTSDGKTPGGEVIAGALVAGDSTATNVPTFHSLYGQLGIVDTVGNNVDEDTVFYVDQGNDLTSDAPVSALDVTRRGALNGHDYTQPEVLIDDDSNSTAALFTVRKHSATQLQVDSDGIRVHGKFKTGASVAHSLGSYSGNAVPIYDESGTLLGYMPLYA